MLNEDIQPSTIDGIKRYAKKLKRANGIPHHQALNIAAQAASYANFAHANRCLKNNNGRASSLERLFFSVYWSDQKERTIGRETLEVKLSRPLLKVAQKSELKMARGLSLFRLAAIDHLVKDELSLSQTEARKRICSAARTLRFMEATGLKPSRDFDAAYPGRDRNNKLPRNDHSTDWYDPQSGQFILIDEPYSPKGGDSERDEWAKKHNWLILKSRWPGMYYPHQCDLFVVSDASTGFDFTQLMRKIDALPEPVTEENWEGDSVAGHETFLSPLAKTPQDKRRARAKGTILREASKKTIPMNWQSAHNERRPNASMPISKHLEAARLIKAVLQSREKPWSVNQRLRRVSSKLEDWFFAEHPRAETDKYDLFYYSAIPEDDPFVKKAETSEGVIELLQELRNNLLKFYIECAPRNSLIKRVDFSINATKKIRQ